ncbi:MAG: hypothetical protein RLZZ341_1442 [Pseudomonadota bacterium]|jgi:hypothetical protein
MKRLAHAPNLALATLWTDMLGSAGIDCQVMRANACSIAGEIPPDQSQPEIWVLDDRSHARALQVLDELRHAPHRHWACPGCQEIIDGPFELCWNCGTPMPALPGDRA